MSFPRYDTRVAWLAPRPLAASTLPIAALRLATRSVMSAAALALMPTRLAGTAFGPLLPEDPGVAAPAVPATTPNVAPEARAIAPSRTNAVRGCDMSAPLVRAPVVSGGGTDNRRRAPQRWG